MIKEFDFRALLAGILATVRSNHKPGSIERSVAQHLIHDAISLSTQQDANIGIIAAAVSETINHEDITG